MFQGTDRYQKKRQLGSGSFGSVYEVQDIQRNELVALKELTHITPEALYHFKREFRALADLIHPNLVVLHELSSQDDSWFFTMELVTGQDFKTYLCGPEAQGITPAHLDLLREILHQLVEGVMALHASNKLHRDLKPSNVLINEEDRLIILDFGLVTELGKNQTVGNMLMGTVAYMSPEQADCLPLLASADWYSVGVMLYEVLTGKLPFSGNIIQMINAKVSGEVIPPKQIVPWLPDDLDTLCMDLLARDVHKRPQGDEILSRINAQKHVSQMQPISGQVELPLLGREAELKTLSSAFKMSRKGQRVVVLVQGKSGMGKTTLVRHFLNDIEKQCNVISLTGRCYSQESVPYKALDSLIDGLSRYLVKWDSSMIHQLNPDGVSALMRLFPVLQRVKAINELSKQDPLIKPDAHESKRLAVIALQQLLSQAAKNWPLVFFIDDVQWGDSDSASLLLELLCANEPPPSVLFIFCYRSEDLANSPFLSQFVAQLGSQLGENLKHVTVTSLDKGSIKNLANHLLGGAASKAIADSIIHETDGNPYFIFELVRYLHEDDPTGPTLEGSPSLEQVLCHRFRQLSQDERQLLEIVVVAGKPLLDYLACRAARLRKDARTTLKKLKNNHLIRQCGGWKKDYIEPFHSRIHEMLITQIDPQRQKEVHLQLALELERGINIDAETLANHFEAGGEFTKASEYITTAAEHASQTLAFDHAADLYKHSIALNAKIGLNDHALQLKLAKALVNAGRGSEAAPIFLTAAKHASPSEALDCQRHAAESLLACGQIDQGLALMKDLLDAVGLRFPKTHRKALLSFVRGQIILRFRGYNFKERTTDDIPERELFLIDICWSIAGGLGMVDTVYSLDFQRRHLILALKAGDPYRIARALAFEACAVALLSGVDHKRTQKMLDLLRSISERLKHPHIKGLLYFSTAYSALLLGRLKEAYQHCLIAEMNLQKWPDTSWELANVRLYKMISQIALGEYRDLIQSASSLIRDAEQRGNLYLTFSYKATCYVIQLAADQPLAARQQILDLLERWAKNSFHVQHLLAIEALVNINLYLNEGEKALAFIQDNWKRIKQSQFLRFKIIIILMYSARARALLGTINAAQEDDLIKAAEKDVKQISQQGVKWSQPNELLLRAGIAARRKNVEAAVSLLKSAEESADKFCFNGLAVMARYRRGQLLGDTLGDDLKKSAIEWLKEQKILKPELFIRSFTPGFEP